MFFTAIALAAATQSWVPLNSSKAKEAQGQIPPVVTPKATPHVSAPAAISSPPIEPPPVAIVVAPGSEITQSGVSSHPVAAPMAPTNVQNPVSQQTQRPLEITCFGGGTANKAAAATAITMGSVSGSVGSNWIHGSTFGTTTITGTRQQGFGDQVDVRLFTGDDRIRMPRTMLPILRGGKAGWFKLKNVTADARFIRATAAVNIINNPRIYIDRVTGTISISGKAGDFSGQCEAIDASAPAKF